MVTNPFGLRQQSRPIARPSPQLPNGRLGIMPINQGTQGILPERPSNPIPSLPNGNLGIMPIGGGERGPAVTPPEIRNPVMSPSVGIPPMPTQPAPRGPDMSIMPIQGAQPNPAPRGPDMTTMPVSPNLPQAPRGPDMSIMPPVSGGGRGPNMTTMPIQGQSPDSSRYGSWLGQFGRGQQSPQSLASALRLYGR